MKKIFAILLVIMLAMATLCSCKSVFEDVTYKDKGISFTLPNTMRKIEYEGFDFYFTNTAVVFNAKKLDSDFLSESSLKSDISAKEYIDYLMEKNEFELEKSEYKYDEERNLHNFRYSTVSEDLVLMHYVVVAGEPGNIWYIDMCCTQEYFENYLPKFGEWKRSISTY